jgi:hypothetical protein
VQNVSAQVGKFGDDLTQDLAVPAGGQKDGCARRMKQGL